MTWEDDARWLARRLSECEASWRAGDATALATAVALCRDKPLPRWAAAGIEKFICEHRPRPSRQDRIDYTRWSVVQEIRDRADELGQLGYASKWTDGALFETASEALCGTEAAGGAEAVRTSYKKVQKHMKAGAASKYRLG